MVFDSKLNGNQKNLDEVAKKATGLHFQKFNHRIKMIVLVCSAHLDHIWSVRFHSEGHSERGICNVSWFGGEHQWL